MKNKFLIHKLLPILSVFLLVVFILNTSCFAANISSKCAVCEEQLKLNYPDGISSITLTDDGSGKHINNMFLVKLDNDYYIIITCSSNNVHGNEKLYIEDNNLATSPSCYMYAYFKYNSSSNSWVYYGENGSNSSFASNVIKNATFLSSTSDIYTDSSCTDVFFQSTPLGITKDLVEELEKIQIAEQLKTMITGFLKYLIVLVISLIAFWKGWQFLSTQLKKA